MRQREVGVRLALGAARSRIVTQFLFQGLRVTLIGCVAGLALSLATGRLIAGMLYGVSPLDPSPISRFSSSSSRRHRRIPIPRMARRQSRPRPNPRQE